MEAELRAPPPRGCRSDTAQKHGEEHNFMHTEEGEILFPEASGLLCKQLIEEGSGAARGSWDLYNL